MKFFYRHEILYLGMKLPCSRLCVVFEVINLGLKLHTRARCFLPGCKLVKIDLITVENSALYDNLNCNRTCSVAESEPKAF
jgi:hypothetical protein